MTGLELIAAERRRQIEVLGYTADHDAQHEEEELALEAACYVLPPRHRAAPIFNRTLQQILLPAGFTFRGNTDRIRELQKAGALIAAEMDRLIAQRDGGGA